MIIVPLILHFLITASSAEINNIIENQFPCLTSLLNRKSSFDPFLSSLLLENYSSLFLSISLAFLVFSCIFLAFTSFALSNCLMFVWSRYTQIFRLFASLYVRYPIMDLPLKPHWVVSHLYFCILLQFLIH